MAIQTQSFVADGSNGHHRFTLYVTEEWYDIASNKSYLPWRLVLSPLGNGWNWHNYTNGGIWYAISINGEPYEGIIPAYDGWSDAIIRSGELYVTHNADGKKDITCSVSIRSNNVDYLPGSAYVSDVMALSRIPRKATITTAPNFTDEDNPTITLSNPAGNAVTLLEVGIYDAKGEFPYAAYRALDDVTAESYTFELKPEERSLIYSASANLSGPLSAKFYIRTTIGDTVDTHSVERTITIVEADPVIDNKIALALGRGNTVISGCNYMEFTFEAHAIKGASIAKKTVTCGDRSIEIKDSYGVLENVESGNFIFTVTDTRGNTTSEPIDLYYIPYSKPTCAVNVDMDIVEGSMAKATLIISGTSYGGHIDEAANSNKCSVSYRWKTLTGSYCDWIPVVDEEIFYNYSYEITIPNLNDGTTYTFQARIFDEVYVESTAILSNEYSARATPVFDYGEKDFAFNVPVTIQGKPTLTTGMKGRLVKVLTHERVVGYESQSLIRFNREDPVNDNLGWEDLNDNIRNDSIAVFTDEGYITVQKDITALFNIHVCCTNTGASGRSWIRLLNINANWKYAEAISYGGFSTATISIILTLTAGTVLGVQTLEPLNMNDSGFTGSYIEIIEL